jgi:cytochrome c oxidase cbb3-type subunit I
MDTHPRTAAPAPDAVAQVEPDFAARQAIISTIGWLVIAASVALIASVLLAFPGLGFGIPFLTYPRWRAIADNLTVFGWLTTAGIAATFFMIPRLAVAQLHNEVLGAAAVQGWNFLLFGGTAALLLGMNQGRPLAELPFGIDLGILFVAVIVLYDAGVTAVRRRERTLYASAWFLLAGVLLLPVVYIVGNLPVFSGVTDAIANAWYRNAIDMLWLLPVAIGVALYVVPVDSGAAMYSKTLARATFWSLLFVGGWTGGRLLLQSAAPDYLEAIGVGMTMVLAVPVLSAVANLVATARQREHLVPDAFASRFALLGAVLLLVWFALTLAGAIPSVSRFVGNTAWGGGVDALARWGVFSAFALALLYHAFPLLVGRAWYSATLAAFHFWGTLAGVAGVVFTSCASGLVQGALFGGTGRLVEPGALGDVMQVAVDLQHGFQIATAVCFAVIAAAQYAFAANAFLTSRKGPYLVAGAV